MNIKIHTNWIRTIVVNFLVLILLLVCLEILSSMGRIVLGKNIRVPSFGYKDVQIDINSPFHPCNEMKTDVLLSHVPNTRNACKPKNGKVIEDYVVYDSNTNFNNVILTLGGSTTSGFYQNISNGETWPKILSEIAKDKFTIFNGGVGAYSSLQELYKIIRDAPRIKNLRYVISLNGINEIPDYQGSNIERSFRYPFLTNYQVAMNEYQIWIDQRLSLSENKIEYFIRKYMPNTMSLVDYLISGPKSVSDKIIFDAKEYEDKDNYPFHIIHAADRWEINVRRSNAIVTAINGTYLVFLQPTLGIDGIQSIPMKNTSDYKHFESIKNTNYINQIQELYKELKIRCSKLEFCIDISDIAPPVGDVYSDPRHHNEKGNKIIAEAIWNNIILRERQR